MWIGVEFVNSCCPRIWLRMFRPQKPFSLWGPKFWHQPPGPKTIRCACNGGCDCERDPRFWIPLACWVGEFFSFSKWSILDLGNVSLANPRWMGSYGKPVKSGTCRGVYVGMARIYIFSFVFCSKNFMVSMAKRTSIWVLEVLHFWAITMWVWLQQLFASENEHVHRAAPSYSGQIVATRRRNSMGHSTPDAPCIVYLPTFGSFMGQMLVNIPYMEHMGTHFPIISSRFHPVPGRPMAHRHRPFLTGRCGAGLFDERPTSQRGLGLQGQRPAFRVVLESNTQTSPNFNGRSSGSKNGGT